MPLQCICLIRSRRPIAAFVASICSPLFSLPPWLSSTRFSFAFLREHPASCSLHHIPISLSAG